jgi:hypothetical protein
MILAEWWPKGRCRGCETRPGELLATQVQSDVRHTVPLGWRRSADRAAVARSFGYGVNHALPEAFAEPTGAGEGEQDFRCVGINGLFS